MWILVNFLAIIAWQFEIKLVPDGIASDTKRQKSVVIILLKMKFHFKNDICSDILHYSCFLIKIAMGE